MDPEFVQRFPRIVIRLLQPVRAGEIPGNEPDSTGCGDGQAGQAECHLRITRHTSGRQGPQTRKAKQVGGQATPGRLPVKRAAGAGN